MGFLNNQFTQLDRRQGLSDALLQKNLGVIQDGGIANAIAPIIGALLARKTDQNIAGERKVLEGGRDEALTTALMNVSRSTPDTSRQVLAENAPFLGDNMALAQALMPQRPETQFLNTGDAFTQVTDQGPTGVSVPIAQDPLQVDRGGSIDFLDRKTFQPKGSVSKTLSPDQQANQVKKDADEEKKRLEKNFDQETKLRDKFLAQSKDFKDISDAFGRITASAQDPSPAGDLALIFNYMKILDPGSTVREGEFANAENSQGVPGRVRSLYNKVVNGQRLNPGARADFVGRAHQLFQAQESGQAKIESEFSRIAEQSGLNPENVLIDFRVEREIPEMKFESPEQVRDDPDLGRDQKLKILREQFGFE